MVKNDGLSIEKWWYRNAIINGELMGFPYLYLSLYIYIYTNISIQIYLYTYFYTNGLSINGTYAIVNG